MIGRIRSGERGVQCRIRESALAENQCTRVGGEFRFRSFVFTSETTAIGDGVVTGDLNGTFHAGYSDIHQHGDGVISTHGRHAITTAAGTFVTSDEIGLPPDPEPGFVRPNSRLHIVDGSGADAGATGLLHTHGRVNLTTLVGAIGFEQAICGVRNG